jgi:hypothetical protein
MQFLAKESFWGQGRQAIINAIVPGLAALDRLHVQGVAQGKGNVLDLAQVGDPVPGEHALDAGDQVVAEGSDGAEETLRPCRQVAVKNDRAGLVEDAPVHRERVQVDAAAEPMLLQVESHRGLPVKGTMRWVCGNFQHAR